MLDGTFGCVRKQSSGASIEQPKHRDRFFMEQSVVDEFVENHAEQNKDIRLVSRHLKFKAILLQLLRNYYYLPHYKSYKNIFSFGKEVLLQLCLVKCGIVMFKKTKRSLLQ